MVQWRRVSHLPGTVAALAAQVLPVGQQPGGARTLEGQPRVNEGRGATVVIHKERLRRFKKKTQTSEKTQKHTHTYNTERMATGDQSRDYTH